MTFDHYGDIKTYLSTHWVDCTEVWGLLHSSNRTPSEELERSDQDRTCYILIR